MIPSCTKPEIAKKPWLVNPLCWGSTIIICLLIPHVLQCGNAIYYGTQHQSKVTEGSAAIPARAHPQIKNQLSKANVKETISQRSKQKQNAERLATAERLRTTYLSFALRSCAPKCVKKTPRKLGDHQKRWKSWFFWHPKFLHDSYTWILSVEE